MQIISIATSVVNVLLAPQSRALRISAYGDFQCHPSTLSYNIAFEHLSFSMVIRNSAHGPNSGHDNFHDGLIM